MNKWVNYTTSRKERGETDFILLMDDGRGEADLLPFFVKGKRIVAVHALRNKGRGTPNRERETPLERKRDWLTRHTRGKMVRIMEKGNELGSKKFLTKTAYFRTVPALFQFESG